MKRRPFLTGLASIGATSLVAFNTNGEDRESTKEYSSANVISEIANEGSFVLKKVENEVLSFTWMSDASAIIKVKKTGATWIMGPVALQEEQEIDHGHVWARQERSSVEQYPGRFKGEMQGDKIKFTLYDYQNAAVGTFKCKVNLEGEWLTFDISEIDASLPNLMFPTPIENDYLLLPMGVGRLIRKPLNSRFFHTWYSHLNMRFCAGLKKDNNGYLAVFDQGFEDAGILATGLSVMPVWMKSLGKWTANRSIAYAFTTNGYVGVAKKYREWANKKGLLKSLDEKIKQTPQLANMIGGRQISVFQAIPKQKSLVQENSLRPADQVAKTKAEGDNQPPRILFTHKQVQEMLAEVTTSWGVKKGMISIRGWIRGGYDYSHPDVWPPEPTLGAIDDLKKICQPAGAFFSVLHDNYMDIYTQNPSFPKGVIVTNKGKLMRGGQWPGGQAYILNYRDSLAYIKRNWELIKTLGTGGMFVDTTTAVQLYESFEKDNTYSKADDLKYKIESIKFFKAQKQVYGSEETADFGIPYVDFYENRHSRKAGESVPMWPLVFHDCVMNSRYVDPSNMEIGSKPYLEDMLWGYFILFRMGSWNEPEWKNQKEEFMASLPADDWFGSIATAEMTNHEYLSEDFELEKSSFSNGKSIIVNFSKESKSNNGMVYQGLSYSIS